MEDLVKRKEGNRFEDAVKGTRATVRTLGGGRGGNGERKWCREGHRTLETMISSTLFRNQKTFLGPICTRGFQELEEITYLRTKGKLEECKDQQRFCV